MAIAPCSYRKDAGGVRSLSMIGMIAAIVLSQGPALIGYDQAVRCAGLTQAASELEGGESARGRELFDAALFWSLAAMQAAQASGRAAAVAEQDQTRARVNAVRQLSGGDAGARAALATCLTRTPDLD